MKQAVLKEFEQYKARIKSALASEQSMLEEVVANLLVPSGKQMRPLLVLLTAKLHGEVNEKSYAAAMLFEMLHWATLIHDDVVDEAYMRRGELTLGAMMRSKSAVLVGDFLFTRGLAVAARAENYQAITSATRCIEMVVDGELMQSRNAARLTTTKEDYYEIIKLKTAVVLASCAQVGAASVGATEKQVESMYRLGELLGCAFQIQDDILDLTDTNTGKTKYNDLQERKITLPLIFAMEKEGRSEALKQLRRAAHSQKSINWLIAFIKRNEGIEKARKELNDKHREAMEIIRSYPESAVRESLIKFADYVVLRKK